MPATGSVCQEGTAPGSLICKPDKCPNFTIFFFFFFPHLRLITPSFFRY